MVQEDPETWNKALDDLDHYLDLEGPFDGIIGVSQGAALAATFLTSVMFRKTTKRDLKTVILFSCEVVVDPTALLHGAVQPLKLREHELVNIASAHFRTSADMDLCIGSEQARLLFTRGLREELMYEGGPGIPKTMSRTLANKMAQIMRRAIYSAGD